MTVRLPPNPKYFPSLTEWANKLYEYFANQAEVQQPVNPQPVLLPHRVDSEMERATTAGILLYDPVNGFPVISKNDAFKAILLELDSYTATEISDATSEANTVGKYTGRMIYDSTNSAIAVANGSNDTDTWSRFTVATTVTPT